MDGLSRWLRCYSHGKLFHSYLNYGPELYMDFLWNDEITFPWTSLFTCSLLPFLASKAWNDVWALCEPHLVPHVPLGPHKDKPAISGHPELPPLWRGEEPINEDGQKREGRAGEKEIERGSGRKKKRMSSSSFYCDVHGVNWKSNWFDEVKGVCLS